MIKWLYNAAGGVTVMKNKKKQYVAPIIITSLLVAYYAFYFGFLISLIGGFWRVFFGITPVAFSAITIAVCIERIKEIKKGDEDDLSKY